MTRRPWWKRKRWWAVGAVVWLVAYVLGYGPACGLAWRFRQSWIGAAVGGLYRPIDLLVTLGPAPVGNALLRYADYWIDDGLDVDWDDLDGGTGHPF